MGNSGWTNDQPNSITLPPNAQPGDARIVIGPDLPPPLDTYTFSDPLEGGTYRYTSAIIFYPDGDDQSYDYIASVGEIAPGAMLWHVGEVDQGAVVEVAPNFPKVFAFSRNLNTNTSNRYFYGDRGQIQFTDELSISAGNMSIFLNTIADEIRINGFGNTSIQLDAAGNISLLPDSGIGGELGIGADINWAQSTAVNDLQPAAISTASAAYVLTATVCGVAFVAPPSGMVLIGWRSSMDHNTAASRAMCAPEIRDGNVVGAGAVFSAANDNRAIAQQGLDATDAGSTSLITGLTAGADYNISLWQRTNGAGTAFFSSREAWIVPAF